MVSNVWILIISVIGLIAYCSTEQRASACTCKTPEVCQAYSRAENVFVGKLVKVEEQTTGSYSEISAEFEVSRIYKGQRVMKQTIRFSAGGCQPDLTIGRQYFVYGEPPSHPTIICNRTREMGEAKEDIAYAKGLERGQPIFTIAGVFKGLAGLQSAKPLVTITINGEKKIVEIDESGQFSFASTTNTDFNVEIRFEQQNSMFVRSLDGSREVTGSTIHYETHFSPNACDFRTITIGDPGLDSQ